MTNKFFDINKLPTKKGIILFPISMSRISNSQDGTHYYDYMEIFSQGKIVKAGVGINFIYGDYLYFESDEKAKNLKKNILH